MATMLLRKIAAVAQGGLKPTKPSTPVIGNNREKNAHGELYREPKIQPGGGAKGWASNWNLGSIDDAVRTVTINPLGRSLMLGGLLAGGTYLAGPMIGRISRNIFGTQQEYDEYGRPIDISEHDRKWLTGIAGGLGFLGSAALSFDSKRPFWSLMKYPSKEPRYPNQPTAQQPPQQTARNIPSINPMQRTASMGRDDLIPLSMAKEGIMSNPNLSLEMKSRSLDVLNSFPNQNQAVSSNDIVNTAVNTGISGLTGYAVGYLTSTALGLGNPNQVGRTTGIVSAIKSLF